MKDNTLRVKAEEKLWENRANQILQRNEVVDETSNLDDNDTPADGGNGANNDDNHKQNINENAEQT